MLLMAWLSGRHHNIMICVPMVIVRVTMCMLPCKV